MRTSILVAALVLATPACDSLPGGPAGGSDAVDGGDVAGGSDVATPHVPGGRDRVLLKTGDPVGGQAVGRVYQHGVADTGSAAAHVEIREGDSSVGTGIVRWREAEDDLIALATPSDLSAMFGAGFLNNVMVGAAGDVAFDLEDCLGFHDGTLMKRLCADDASLEPGGGLFLSALADDVAMVRIIRSGALTRRFEYLGVGATAAPIEYGYHNLETTGVDTVRLFDVRETAFGANGMVMLGGGTSTVTGVTGWGVMRAEGNGPPSLIGFTFTGNTSGGSFPGVSWPPDARAGSINTFRGVTITPAGDIGVLYAPTLGDGSVHATTGLYTIGPGETAARRHVDLAAPLAYEGGASPLLYIGGTAPHPAIIYGLTDDRRVVFLARLVDETIGIWREDRAGQLVSLTKTGDVATDGAGQPIVGVTFAELGTIVTGSEGALMFTARLEGADVTNDNQLGVWGVGARDGTPRLLARRGDPMPGGAAGLIVSVGLHPGVQIPDVAGVDGLHRRGIDESIVAYGGAGTSQTIRPGACGEGVLRVTGGGTEMVVLRGLAVTCPDEETPQRKVNSVGDLGDAVPGDGSCDTGSTVASGDPECTLRAALEEANANPSYSTIEFELDGPGPHTIAPVSGLPTISGSVSIIGPPSADAPALIIDGANAGVTSGFEIDAGSVRLTRLRITGFAEHGVSSFEGSAPLTLSSVLINQNCGWGVRTENAGIVDTADGGFPSQIAFNGTANGCEGGGGLLALADTFDSVALRLTDTLVHDNNGPGLVAWGSAVLSGVTIEANNAQGVYIYDDGSDLTFLLGDSVVTNNMGVGVHHESSGNLRAAEFDTLTVTGNGSWGIHSEGVLRLGDVTATPTARSAISDNGRGTACREWIFDADDELVASDLPCQAGGIFALGDEDDLRVFLGYVDIEDNNGPGVLIQDRLELSSAAIRRNAGPGVVQEDGLNGGVGETITLLGTLGRSFITDNRGEGVVLDSGTAKVQEGSAITIEGNRGWGINTRFGGVELGNLGSDAAEATRIIKGNGGGVDCVAWTLDDNELPVATPMPCGGGGVWVEDGNLSAVGATIQSNAGPGIKTEAGTVGDGDVTLLGGLVCDNTPDFEVAGTQTLTDVMTGCP